MGTKLAKTKAGMIINITRYTAAFLIPCVIFICAFAAERDKKGNPPAKTDGIDIDLTALSGTMVFAQVSNIMQAPQKYIGKTIKTKGVYNGGCYEEPAVCLHFLVILDAAGCCPSGFEFRRNGESPNAGALTENGTAIEIAGTFKSYVRSGWTYYYIDANNVKVLGNRRN
jgi:hypothetical protein